MHWAGGGRVPYPKCLKTSGQGDPACILRVCTRGSWPAAQGMPSTWRPAITLMLTIPKPLGTITYIIWMDLNITPASGSWDKDLGREPRFLDLLLFAPFSTQRGPPLPSPPWAAERDEQATQERKNTHAIGWGKAACMQPPGEGIHSMLSGDEVWSS